MAVANMCQALASTGNWIYDFQTLITGVLAIGAAFWASKIAAGQLDTAKKQIEVTREQIESDKYEADRARKARLRAVRATLPVTLSSICEYSQLVASGLNNAWPVSAALYPNDDNGLRNYRVEAAIPDIPYDQLESLELVLEFTDTEAVALQIESLLRELQVLAARLAPLRLGAEVGTDWLASLMLQTATLYARAESLFTYARGKAPGPNTAPLWGRVHAALNIMKIYNPKVLALAEAQMLKGDEPGEANSIEPL